MHLTFLRDGAPEDSWWTFTLSPLRDERGAVAELLIVTDETTERVVTDRARQMASERLRRALATGDRIGSWDWDVVRNRVYADAQFALLYCVEPERAVAGVPVEQFLGCIDRDDLERVQAEIRRAMSTGEEYYSEYRVVGSGGQIRWIAAQGTPTFNDDGCCVRFPGVSFDVTANRKLEPPS